MSALGNIIPEDSLIERKRSNFTKSLDLGQGQRAGIHTEDDFESEYDFCNSIHVVSNVAGQYEVYKPQKHKDGQEEKSRKSLTASLKEFFKRKNGSGRRDMPNYDNQIHSNNYSKDCYAKSHNNSEIGCNPGNTSCDQILKGGNYGYGKRCSCCQYHYHTFDNATFFRPPELTANAETNKDLLPKMELAEANQRHLNVCNTFWRPSLSLNQQSYANRVSCLDMLVDFESLWPETASLRSLLTDGLHNTALNDAVPELALVAIVCGPVRLLDSMVKLSLVRLDSHLEDGQGLLHYACLMQRPAMITYLTKSGVLAELPDRRGYTADETCFNDSIWKQLPSKYRVNTHTCPARQAVPSEHDRSVLFRMVQTTGNVYEIQMHLQTLNFNVNTECNQDGDFLIHIAVRGGLCQLPLIMTLVRLQNADIELCNIKGMTPLMIAAQSGNSILCDVLICVLGADPNKVNVENGRSALHYAAQNCHGDVVSCLIKRGCDINCEDYHGFVPDKLPTMHQFYTSSDCQDIIQLHRLQRQDFLANKVIHGDLNADDLVESDLCTVNEDGLTFVMLAAIHNRVQNLTTLLDCSVKSIDAQFYNKSETNYKTGMTAVAMAAKEGHKDTVRCLLLRGANPCISDMADDLPLHHAVRQRASDVIEVILDFFPATYVGLKKAKDMCDNPACRSKIHQAWLRRQEEIVTPQLFEYSIDGKADQLYCLLEDGDIVDSKSGFGSWPLYLAIQNRHLDVIKLLCERGADLRKRHFQTGNTVLHLAVDLRHLDVIEFLLTFGKPIFGVDVGRSSGNSCRNLSINAINRSHKTALQLASEKGYLEVVRCLLNIGATTALLDVKGNLFSVPEFQGVWSEIMVARQKHTENIISLIEKGNLAQLMKIWVPGFDHNLRNQNGDTPLMVASSLDNIDIILFLLQSAVHPQSFVDDDEYLENFSDNDSGVLDEDLIRRSTPDDEVRVDVTADSQMMTKYTSPDKAEHGMVDVFLTDVAKPVGLSIYHDGLVSHVCAVNSKDNSTALHRCLERGDNFKVLELLLKIDDTCVNIQNSSGFTPLHLACQLNRKKCVEVLLTSSELDLSILTLDAKLPEEMTKNKNIIKIIKKNRRRISIRDLNPEAESCSSSVTNMSMDTKSTVAPSTINLDKVRERFEALKRNGQRNS